MCFTQNIQNATVPPAGQLHVTLTRVSVTVNQELLTSTVIAVRYATDFKFVFGFLFSCRLFCTNVNIFMDSISKSFHILYILFLSIQWHFNLCALAVVLLIAFYNFSSAWRVRL